MQEGLVGLYKAIRDYRVDKDTTFRSFAELCITRQIITAIKTATRHKHAPLNGALSFSHTPAGYDDGSDFTLGDALPGSPIDDPARRVVATEELEALVGCLGSSLSPLEAACSRSTSRAAPTRRSARSSSATRRRSTTPCSASSARSASTSPRARCSTPELERLRRGSCRPRRAGDRRAARAQRDAGEVDAVGQRPELDRRGELPA